MPGRNTCKFTSMYTKAINAIIFTIRQCPAVPPHIHWQKRETHIRHDKQLLEYMGQLQSGNAESIKLFLQRTSHHTMDIIEGK